MTTMTAQLASDVIRERTTQRHHVQHQHQHLQRPSHARTAKALRGLADRFDRRF